MKTESRQLFSIAKAAALVGLSTAVTVFAGLIRAKVSALWLGPSGVSLVSQAQDVGLFLMSVASLGMNVGLLALVPRALSKAEPEKVGALIDSALVMVLACGLLLAVVTLVAHSWLERSVFASSPRSGLALTVALANAVISAVYFIPWTLLYAHGQVRAFVSAMVIATLVGVAVLVGLILTLGVTGALLHLVVAPVLLLACLLRACRRHLPATSPPLGRRPLRPSKACARELLSYTAYVILSSASTYGAQVVARSLVLARLGIEVNGFLQPAIALTSYMRQLVVGGIFADLFPMTARGDLTGEDLVSYLRSALRFCLALSLPVAIGITLFGGWIIRLLYSSVFAGGVASHLGFFLVGEAVRQLATACVALLVARRSVWLALVVTFVGEGVFLGAFAATAGHGLTAYGISWAAGGLCSLACALLALRGALSIRLGPATVATLVLLPSAIACGLAAVPPLLVIRVPCAIVAVAIAWRFGLQETERTAILSRVRRMVAPARAS